MTEREPPLAVHPQPLADRDIVLAAIIGAHGIAGEVRLKLFAQSLASLSAHKRFNGGALTLTNVRPGSNGTIARFAEIKDRNAAEAARGTQLSIPRAALPPLADGEYYHVDLIGLACRTASGQPIGACVAVENFGAGDVIEIERPGGKRFMVPIRAVTFAADAIEIDDDFVNE